MSFIVSKRRSATPSFLLWRTCHIEPIVVAVDRARNIYKTRHGSALYIYLSLCSVAFRLSNCLLAENSGREISSIPIHVSLGKENRRFGLKQERTKLFRAAGNQLGPHVYRQRSGISGEEKEATKSAGACPASDSRA